MARLERLTIAQCDPGSVDSVRPGITLGTYSHVLPTMQRDAAQLVASAFLG